MLVRGDEIEAVGPRGAGDRAGRRDDDHASRHDAACPGSIEGHSHLLLHPYNETPWDDQVLHEPDALRVARAVNHARATLMAGFTTVRDLGTEGAGYADVGLKQAINQGIIPGPRMVVVTKAIVVTGSTRRRDSPPNTWTRFRRAPRRPTAPDKITRVVRDQIKHGADWIKVYADYRWGPNGEAMPAFTQEEFNARRRSRRAPGRSVAAHATTAEGMRRAVLAGVATIEHGDNGTPEVFKLMAERGVCYVPTVSVGGRNKKAVLK